MSGNSDRTPAAAREAFQSRLHDDAIWDMRQSL